MTLTGNEQEIAYKTDLEPNNVYGGGNKVSQWINLGEPNLFIHLLLFVNMPLFNNMRLLY